MDSTQQFASSGQCQSMPSCSQHLDPIPIMTTALGHAVTDLMSQTDIPGTRGTTSQSDSDVNKTNLIVNYLPQAMTQEELQSIFARLGEIHSCKLICERPEGKSLCYGFVNYKNATDAEKAVTSLNRLRVQNKTIKVSLALPRSESRKNANLFICGLPQSVTQSNLQALFAPFGTIVNSRIIYNQTGISKGFAFVHFDKKCDAEQAIQTMNKYIPEGCLDPITVTFANSPSVNRKLAGTTLATHSRHRYSPMTVGLPTTLSMATVVAPAATSSQSTTSALNVTGWCILVKNLASDAEDISLWQLFGPFGAVQSVKIIHDLATKKCTGFGLVTMTHQEDAVIAARNLNGYRLGNQVLQVTLTD